MEESQPLLSWRARTRPEHERTRAWYVGASVFLIAMVLYGIGTGSVGFAVLMLMCAVAYYFFVIRGKPTVKEVCIMEEGIHIDHEFFPWNRLDGFWFQKYADYTQFHLEHKEHWRTDTIVQTGPVSILHIRKLLSAHLPEHADRTEQILDKISRICKI